MSIITVGELLYEYTAQITQIVEYGVSFAGLVSGELPPPEGARFDVQFSGQLQGKLNGQINGVDFVHVRADGRFQLHIHARIITADAVNISVFADGVAIPQGGTAELRENVSLFTSTPAYTWLNTCQIWQTGTIDLATQIIKLQGFIA